MTRRALIHQDHISHNIQMIQKKCPQAKVLAYLKADAYGHGIKHVVPCMHDIEMIAVATYQEARCVRHYGYLNPVLIQSDYFTDDLLDEALAENFVPLAENMALYERLKERKKPHQVLWLKYNTGMNRLGLTEKQVMQCLSDWDGPCVVLTHMAYKANHVDNIKAIDQINELKKKTGCEICYAPTTLIWSDIDISSSDWVAPGLSLYGLGHPSLKLVMQLQSQVISLKNIPAGSKVGYGGKFVASSSMSFAHCAIGYGDGLPRNMEHYCCRDKQGRNCAVIGYLSMDLMSVACSRDVKVGDWLDIWVNGEDIQFLEQCSGIIAYALLSQLGARVERLAVMSTKQMMYKCRRGLRELDELLLSFCQQHYSMCTPEEKIDFAALLDHPDPLLQQLFFIQPDSNETPIIKLITKKAK